MIVFAISSLLRIQGEYDSVPVSVRTNSGNSEGKYSKLLLFCKTAKKRNKLWVFGTTATFAIYCHLEVEEYAITYQAA